MSNFIIAEYERLNGDFVTITKSSTGTYDILLNYKITHQDKDADYVMKHMCNMLHMLEFKV